MNQLVVVEDTTSPGVISPSEVNKLVETLELYAKDINHSPWVEHGYIKPIEVKFLPKGNPFPKGAYNLILQDNIDVAEALGYHEDENGGKIPVSYIPVKEIREDNASVSEVATHELVEMACDPFVIGNDIRIAKYLNKEYVVEPADPLESCGYRAINGYLVANFVWPRYYGMAQTRLQLAQSEGYIFSPVQLAPNGYYSSRLIGSNKEFEPVFGDKRTNLPKWATRLPRIGSA